MDLKPATELRAVTRNLYGWASFHPQWKTDFNSYALKTSEGVVFVDPLKPDAEVIKKLEALGEPIGILLTNAYHNRDADWFRKQYEIQVYAHEKAKADCETNDRYPADGWRAPAGRSKSRASSGQFGRRDGLLRKNQRRHRPDGGHPG